MLTDDELQRYSRQIGPGVLSRQGQERLRESSVLVTRAGGMGGPAALALTTAGVGRIVLAHGGRMITPDLNRQILGSEATVGEFRAPHFADYLRSMNRYVEVEPLDHEPDDDEALEIAARVDAVLSCPPTFDERLRLSRAAVDTSTPLIDAAQWGMMGTLIVVDPSRTACLRCVYPQEPPFEELFPVVGAISAAIGSLAALEAIKILSGCGEPIFGKMLMYDGFRGRASQIDLRRDPQCPVCGDAR
ncbi:MAG: HesA/MoeB/ThiF family protein [Pirellulales bacterium]|nr:HesA/MoeB/ThiF family protein [Planctomycetales bacterium]